MPHTACIDTLKGYDREIIPGMAVMARHYDLLPQATRLVLSAACPVPQSLSAPPIVGPIIDRAEVRAAADALERDGVHRFELSSLGRANGGDYRRWLNEIERFASARRLH